LNHYKSIYASTLLFSIALFVLGQVLFVKAFAVFEPDIDGILFQIIEQGRPIKTSLLFSFTLALIPGFILLTWRLGGINSLNKKIASILLILTFIIIAIFARHQQVKIYFNTVVKPVMLTNGTKSIQYPIDPINFVYYIFSGLCAGCILSFFLFRNRN
jgi:hypothetical protein